MESIEFKNVISAAELVRWRWRPHGWLLWQMVPIGGITLLAGETASGKSFLGLDLALGMASGRGKAWDMDLGEGFLLDSCDALKKSSSQEENLEDPLPPQMLTESPRGRLRTARVRYFCGDADPNLMAERVMRLCRGYTNTKTKMRMDAPDALDLDFNAHEFSDPQSFGWLQKEVARQDYELLVFDGLAQYLPGMADGSAAAVGAFLRGLRQMASMTGVSVVLIHQFNKRQAARLDKWGLPTSQGEERVRGSSELLAGVDSVLLVSRPEAMKLGGMGRTALKVVKNRLGQAGARLHFTIVDGEDSLHLLFERLGEQAQPKPRRLADAALDGMMRILMTEDDHTFDRWELTKRLQEKMILPGARTLAEAFGMLGKDERVRVEKKENGKRLYSWATPGTGAIEKNLYGLPPAMALDLATSYVVNKARLMLAEQEMEKLQNKDKPTTLTEQIVEMLTKGEGNIECQPELG